MCVSYTYLSISFFGKDRKPARSPDKLDPRILSLVERDVTNHCSFCTIFTYILLQGCSLIWGIPIRIVRTSLFGGYMRIPVWGIYENSNCSSPAGLTNARGSWVFLKAEYPWIGEPQRSMDTDTGHGHDTTRTLRHDISQKVGHGYVGDTLIFNI